MYHVILEKSRGKDLRPRKKKGNNYLREKGQEQFLFAPSQTVESHQKFGRKGSMGKSFRMAKNQKGEEEKETERKRKKQENDYTPGEERFKERSAERREDYSSNPEE